MKDYFVQKALDSNLNNSINEFYEFRNFINTWSQDNNNNNYTNLLLTGYECKPVKKTDSSSGEKHNNRHGRGFMQY